MAAPSAEFEYQFVRMGQDGMMQDQVQDPEMPSVDDTVRLCTELAQKKSSKKYGDKTKVMPGASFYRTVRVVLSTPDLDVCESATRKFQINSTYTLHEDDGITVLKKGKPVIAYEHIHNVLAWAHGKTGHGGRDRTFDTIKNTFDTETITKELTGLWKQLCPKCDPARRPANPPNSRSSSSGVRGPDDLPTPPTPLSLFGGPDPPAPEMPQEDFTESLAFNGPWKDNTLDPRYQGGVASALSAFNRDTPYPPPAYDSNPSGTSLPLPDANNGGFIDPSLLAASPHGAANPSRPEVDQAFGDPQAENDVAFDANAIDFDAFFPSLVDQQGLDGQFSWVV